MKSGKVVLILAGRFAGRLIDFIIKTLLLLKTNLHL